LEGKGCKKHFKKSEEGECRSRIHERTISLRFLDIILRVLRLEVSVYNVYITKPVSNHFCSRGGRGKKIR
jgi:hypothetical protein